MFGEWRKLILGNPNARRHLVAWGLLSFGFLGVQGVLLNLYLVRLGYGPEFIGLLLASGQIAWAGLALPAATYGRRAGLRNALVLACLLMGSGLALLLLVELLPRPLWSPWLFSCWIVLWSGAALNTVNSIPYLMVITRDAERSYAFAAQSALVAGMSFAGSMVAGVMASHVAGWLGASLDDPAPYRYALLAAPLVTLMGAGAYLASDQTPPIRGSGRKSSLKPPRAIFGIIGAVVFLGAAADGAVRPFFNLYLDRFLGIPAVHIGALMGLGQFVPIFIALAIPRILTRFGSARALALGLAGMGFALLPLAAFASLGVATVSFMGLLCMNAIREPTRKIFSQEIVAPHWGTTSSAIGTIATALGMALTAALGGYVIEISGFQTMFLLGAGLGFSASLVLLGYLRAKAPKATTAVGP